LLIVWCELGMDGGESFSEFTQFPLNNQQSTTHN
jgi:hypothetical protein